MRSAARGAALGRAPSVSGCLRQIDFLDAEVATLDRGMAERALRSSEIRWLMTVQRSKDREAARYRPRYLPASPAGAWLSDMPDSPLAAHASSPSELVERLEASRQGTAFLVFRDAQGRQRTHALDKERSRATIGGVPSADVMPRVG